MLWNFQDIWGQTAGSRLQGAETGAADPDLASRSDPDPLYSLNTQIQNHSKVENFFSVFSANFLCLFIFIFLFECEFLGSDIPLVRKYFSLKLDPDSDHLNATDPQPWPKLFSSIFQPAMVLIAQRQAKRLGKKLSK